MSAIKPVQRAFEPVPQQLLVTSSLVDAVAFHTGLPLHSDWKTKSLLDLQGQLSRAPWSGDSVFTKRGQDFEDKICAMSRVSSVDKFLKAFEPECMCDVEKLIPFYNHVKDGKFQKEMKAHFEIQGQKFTFYGKADVAHPEYHVDIKTTSSLWKEEGKFSSRSKYEGRAQHRIYMVLDNVHRFLYLIGEFIDLNKDKATLSNGQPNPQYMPDWRVIDVHEVEIIQEDLEAMKQELHSQILSAVNFISQDPTMWANYCNVFTRSWK